MHQKEVLITVGVLVVGFFLFGSQSSYITGLQAKQSSGEPEECNCFVGSIYVMNCEGGTAIYKCVFGCPRNEQTNYYFYGHWRPILSCSANPDLLNLPRGIYSPGAYPFSPEYADF